MLVINKMPRRLNMIIGRIGDNLFFFIAVVMIKKASDTNIDERRITCGMLI